MNGKGKGKRKGMKGGEERRGRVDLLSFLFVCVIYTSVLYWTTKKIKFI
jgi:hypothetical protein